MGIRYGCHLAWRSRLTPSGPKKPHCISPTGCGNVTVLLMGCRMGRLGNPSPHQNLIGGGRLERLPRDDGVRRGAIGSKDRRWKEVAGMGAVLDPRGRVSGSNQSPRFQVLCPGCPVPFHSFLSHRCAPESRSLRCLLQRHGGK